MIKVIRQFPVNAACQLLPTRVREGAKAYRKEISSRTIDVESVCMRGRDDNRTNSDTDLSSNDQNKHRQAAEMETTHRNLVIDGQLTSPAKALATDIYQYPVVGIGGLVVLDGEREVDGGVLRAGFDDDVVQSSASNVGVVDGVGELYDEERQ